VKKTLVICLALLVVTSVVALAQDAITINGGNMSVAMKGRTGQIVKGHVPLKTIYSNFSSNSTDMYNCCTGWTISEGSTLGYEFTAANSITLTKAATMHSITSALSTVEGNADNYVEFVKDCKGEPCRVDYEGKHTICYGKASYTQVFGNCCAVVTTKCKAKLKKKVPYWIVMESLATDNNWNVWNWSNASNGPGYDSYSYNDEPWVSNGNSYDQGGYSLQ